MNIKWQRMSLDEYAAFSASQGIKAVKVRDTWWREVRPFFYRPLLVCRECQTHAIKAPLRAKLGGFQHALPAGSPGNSFLNLLIFDKPGEYSLRSLNWSRRKQIKIAENEFQIRPVVDAAELEKAYPVYLSFFNRTNYDYKSERREPQKFSAWAETIFQHPKVMVLGAYRKDELGAICLTQCVEDVLHYSTVFCDTDSLRTHVTGLMLHKVREAAAQINGLKSIFTGPYKYEAAQGVDDFYLSRGCKLVSKPAFLHINPVAGLLLKRFAPGVYNKLRGDLPSGETPAETPDPGADRSNQKPLQSAQANATLEFNPHERSSL